MTDLETAKRAQEDAVRSIIQESMSKTGPKINEFVTLGGAIEVTAARSSNFSGKTSDTVSISTAELDLEIRANEWMLGTLVLNYDSGTNILFPTTNGTNIGVDRVTVDQATVLIGDVQRFPIFMKVGRDVLAFGTSTGTQRLDVLSINNPLSIEVFETRRNAIGVGFAFPTPEPGPPPPPVVVPPVRPLVLNPLVSSLGKWMGYVPSPLRPKPPTPMTFAPRPPPFYGMLYGYDANSEGINRHMSGSLNGRLGYQASGHCGLPYSELTESWVCPWSFDLAVDYISSVFDSNFLTQEYQNFLPQIGKVPGMAVSLKAAIGRFLLITEWNGALNAARFVDDAGRNISMTPSAWQVSLGYQFDWNPWVETIGGQGTYIAVGYSRSAGLAGVTSTATGAPTRVGTVPQSRLILTAGEWVMEGARVILEYSHIWDYPVSQGGTGRQADGVFLGLTYVW
ncbi:MAG: hypothetical protein AB7S57_22385 [Acetobacteraceae bacterium]